MKLLHDSKTNKPKRFDFSKRDKFHIKNDPVSRFSFKTGQGTGKSHGGSHARCPLKASRFSDCKW